MKEYQFVRLSYGGFFYPEITEHQQIIHDRAAQGWRYVGYIPVTISSGGTLSDIDLVFERDKV